MMTWSSYALSDQHPTQRPEQLREQESQPDRQQYKSSSAEAFAVFLNLYVTLPPGANRYCRKECWVEEKQPPSVFLNLYPASN